MLKMIKHFLARIYVLSNFSTENNRKPIYKQSDVDRESRSGPIRIILASRIQEKKISQNNEKLT